MPQGRPCRRSAPRHCQMRRHSSTAHCDTDVDARKISNATFCTGWSCRAAPAASIRAEAASDASAVQCSAEQQCATNGAPSLPAHVLKLRIGPRKVWRGGAVQYADQSQDAAVHMQHRQRVGLQSGVLLHGTDKVMLRCGWGASEQWSSAGHQSGSAPRCHLDPCSIFLLQGSTLQSSMVFVPKSRLGAPEWCFSAQQHSDRAQCHLGLQTSALLQGGRVVNWPAVTSCCRAWRGMAKRQGGCRSGSLPWTSRQRSSAVWRGHCVALVCGVCATPWWVDAGPAAG